MQRLALEPVFAAQTHGCDTVDHFRIDPRLGDDADFDRLVAAAHMVRPAFPERPPAAGTLDGAAARAYELHRQLVALRSVPRDGDGPALRTVLNLSAEPYALGAGSGTVLAASSASAVTATCELSAGSWAVLAG